jgi:CheY-like chemotaxis protein
MARFRALVVDDELQVRHITARALSRCGFECELACDGKEALSLIRDGNFDLVVTDLRMPDVNGHRLATELLLLEDRPVISVLTGIEEPKLAKDLVARGVDRICYKPVDYLEFASDLLSIVEQRMSAKSKVGCRTRDVITTSLGGLHTADATLENDSAGQLQPRDASAIACDYGLGRMRVNQHFGTDSRTEKPPSPNNVNSTTNDPHQVESAIDISLINSFARNIQSELMRTKCALEELQRVTAHAQSITYFNLGIALFSGLLSGVLLGWLGSWYLNR